MSRKTQLSRLEAIYNTIEKNPGERPGNIASLLGMHRSQVSRSLPALEEFGYLLSEDKKGGLWPFHRMEVL